MKLKKLFQWIRILLFSVVLVGGCVLVVLQISQCVPFVLPGSVHVAG